MTLRTTSLKSELTLCTTGGGVPWLWACQQRVRRSVRRGRRTIRIPLLFLGLGRFVYHVRRGAGSRAELIM